MEEGWDRRSPHLWTSLKLGVKVLYSEKFGFNKGARPSQSAPPHSPPHKGTFGMGKGLPPDLKALWSSISKEPRPQAMKERKEQKAEAVSDLGRAAPQAAPHAPRLPQGGARQNKQEHRELRFYLCSTLKRQRKSLKWVNRPK